LFRVLPNKDIASLMMQGKTRDEINAVLSGPMNLELQAFYEEMPFNYYGEAHTALDSINTNPIQAYPDLDAMLEDDSVRTVLEIGCGAGWASNSIAYHYGKTVTAVDFTAKALERAAEVSRLIGTEQRIQFVHSDLFQFDTEKRFDLVLSIGVLHHTNDCHAAFCRAASFVKPGGLFFVGLYHSYGRKPFLDLFRGIAETEGEDAAFERYAALHADQTDPTHLRSWFRDQVLHPQESQHSLAEVMTWLDKAGMTLLSTSINQYGEVDDRAELEELEKSYSELSVRRNVKENRYFPGFFTVLAQR
jgi:SAM-dependent methyltransferase